MSTPSIFTRLLRALGLLKRPAKVIVVGLDNSGKSSLINALKPARAASYEVTPTVGFAMERFERGGFTFSVWDMSGASTYRSLWETYYKGVDAVLFVLDSSDRMRVCVARDELDTLLAHADIAAAKPPMLFFANKQDLPGALEPAEASVLLGLPALTDRAWQITASNALTGDGVQEGLAWLVQTLNAGHGGGGGTGVGGAGGGSTGGAIKPKVAAAAPNAAGSGASAAVAASAASASHGGPGAASRHL